MMWFLLLCLVVALAITLVRLRAHHRAVRTLREGIAHRRPLLREDLPGAAGPDWESLCDTTNGIISDANRLQHEHSGQLSQLEATLGSLQEAVLIVDAHNYVLLANQALRAIFPRAEKILNERLELVLHSVEFLNYVEAVRHRKAPARREIEFTGDGHSVWLEVTGTTIAALGGGKVPDCLFVLHDITRQKRLESIRKDFVANVSHELRTPLSVIKGYVETLVDGHPNIPLLDQEKFLKTIQRHTERLNSLLEDLLTLSRLESINPGLNRETVALPRLLQAVQEDYGTRAAAAAHALSFEIDPALQTGLLDPLKITQALENLIDNALKYTPNGTRITVSARALATEVEIVVHDNGPGIPAEDLPHLFERFYRVDKGRSRDKGGTGLGLSIVKHIVQLHGGRIWVNSTMGQGTTFGFTLPATPPPAARTPT